MGRDWANRGWGQIWKNECPEYWLRPGYSLSGESGGSVAGRCRSWGSGRASLQPLPNQSLGCVASTSHAQGSPCGTGSFPAGSGSAPGGHQLSQASLCQTGSFHPCSVSSTLYIVIGFCRGAGSSPTLFAHSKSIKQLVQPKSIRAFVVAPFAVLRASRCTWMESSRGMHDNASFSTFVRRFIGSTFLLATVSFLSFSSASIRVCLRCKIVYFGVLDADTGTGRGLGYLHPRRQFGLTGPCLQNPAPQQEPFSLSRTTPGGPGATQSHSRSLQDYDLGFPWHRPAASGSAGVCLGGGTL